MPVNSPSLKVAAVASLASSFVDHLAALLPRFGTILVEVCS